MMGKNGKMVRVRPRTEPLAHAEVNAYFGVEASMELEPPWPRSSSPGWRRLCQINRPRALMAMIVVHGSAVVVRLHHPGRDPAALGYLPAILHCCAACTGERPPRCPLTGDEHAVGALPPGRRPQRSANAFARGGCGVLITSMPTAVNTLSDAAVNLHRCRVVGTAGAERKPAERMHAQM